MTARGPRKPRTQGRRKTSANIPSDVIVAAGRAAEGVGSRFMELSTRQPDLGHGLPVAFKPVIAVTPEEIRRRAFEKREANRRVGTANNVRGYVAPGAPQTADLPEDLLHLTSEQEDASTAVLEGSYHFPQVSPTKTINPNRPRTLEAGWERITDRSHQSYPGILRVRFRDGTPWAYHNIPSSVWQRFKRVQSPGRFINRVLNQYPYERGNF